MSVHVNAATTGFIPCGPAPAADSPTGTGASSAQMYYESMHSGSWPTPSTTPTGVANFAEDVAIRHFAEPLNTIVHWAEYDRGGHFAALEVPGLYVSEVTSFFGTHR